MPHQEHTTTPRNSHTPGPPWPAGLAAPAAWQGSQHSQEPLAPGRAGKPPKVTQARLGMSARLSPCISISTSGGWRCCCRRSPCSHHTLGLCPVWLHTQVPLAQNPAKESCQQLPGPGGHVPGHLWEPGIPAQGPLAGREDSNHQGRLQAADLAQHPGPVQGLCHIAGQAGASLWGVTQTGVSKALAEVASAIWPKQQGASSIRLGKGLGGS
jgi:hypothetical protein